MKRGRERSTHQRPVASRTQRHSQFRNALRLLFCVPLRSTTLSTPKPELPADCEHLACRPSTSNRVKKNFGTVDFGVEAGPFCVCVCSPGVTLSPEHQTRRTSTASPEWHRRRSAPAGTCWGGGASDAPGGQPTPGTRSVRMLAC